LDHLLALNIGSPQSNPPKTNEENGEMIESAQSSSVAQKPSIFDINTNKSLAEVSNCILLDFYNSLPRFNECIIYILEARIVGAVV